MEKEIYQALLDIKEELQAIRSYLEREITFSPVRISRQGVEEAFAVLFHLSEFPQDSIPALQKCSTGEELVSDNAFLEDSNDSHQKIQKACICIAIHLNSFRQQDKKNKIADFGEPCLLCQYAGDCNLDWLSVMEPVLSIAPGIINIEEHREKI